PTPLGSAALIGGVATLTVSALTRGSHSITASYGGDGSKFTASASGTIATVAGTATGGYNGDGIPATLASRPNAEDVAIDPSGTIYIADTYNYRIREIVKATGQIITVAGNGTAGYSGDGGPATSAQLLVPRAIAVDAAGNVYIADTDNQRVREVVKA